MSLNFEVQSYLLTEVLKHIQVLPPEPNEISINAMDDKLTIFAVGEGYADYILTTCPATVIEPGSVVLNDAKKFCMLMAEYKESIGFRLDSKNNKMIINSGKRSFKFDIVSDGIVAKIPDDLGQVLQKANHLNLNNFLIECLKLKAFQEIGDEFRTWRETVRAIVYPNESYILLDLAEGGTFARNRYGCQTISHPETYYLFIKNLVKANMLFKKSNDGWIVNGSNYICISDETTYYFIAKPEAKYPDVDKVWTNKLNNRSFQVTIDLEQFKRAIKSAKILVSRDRNIKVEDAAWLIFKNGKLNIVIEKKFHEELELKSFVAPLDFRSSYSCSKIYDALQSIYTNDEVLLEAVLDGMGENTPIILSDGIGLEIAIGKQYTRSYTGDI